MSTKPITSEVLHAERSVIWLLTELDPEHPDTSFLCDLGMGFPELGSVHISELESIRRPLGLLVERDNHFSRDRTLSQYADAARARGAIED